MGISVATSWAYENKPAMNILHHVFWWTDVSNFVGHISRSGITEAWSACLPLRDTAKWFSYRILVPPCSYVGQLKTKQTNKQTWSKANCRPPVRHLWLRAALILMGESSQVKFRSQPVIPFERPFSVSLDNGQTQLGIKWSPAVCPFFVFCLFSLIVIGHSPCVHHCHLAGPGGPSHSSKSTCPGLCCPACGFPFPSPGWFGCLLSSKLLPRVFTLHVLSAVSLPQGLT